MAIGRERLRQILHAHGISFQRTRTWKESADPDKDAKLDRIEHVTGHYPDRCFAFDQFGMPPETEGSHGGRSSRTTWTLTGCQSRMGGPDEPANLHILDPDVHQRIGRGQIRPQIRGLPDFTPIRIIGKLAAMISAELKQIMDNARAALAQEPQWSAMNSVPAGIPRPRGMEAPDEYLDFLETADGGIFGRVIIFGLKSVGRDQEYVDYSELARIHLERESWFCFGRVNRASEDPLFIERENGSVWGFPDTGYPWYDNDQFNRFADSLGEFLENYAFGPKYRAISGAAKDEEWWRLLERIGRAE